MAKGMFRDKQLEAQWRRIIREHGGSGLTIRAFCRKGKLHESAFHFWRSELQRRDNERCELQRRDNERCELQRRDNERCELQRRSSECRQAEQEQRQQSKRSGQVTDAASTPNGGQNGHTSVPAFVEVRLVASSVERLVASNAERLVASNVDGVEDTSLAGARRQIGNPAGGRIEIELSGGRRIHITPPVDRAALADVMVVLSLDLGARDDLSRVASSGLSRAVPSEEDHPC